MVLNHIPLVLFCFFALMLALGVVADCVAGQSTSVEDGPAESRTPPPAAPRSAESAPVIGPAVDAASS